MKYLNQRVGRPAPPLKPAASPHARVKRVILRQPPPDSLDRRIAGPPLTAAQATVLETLRSGRPFGDGLRQDVAARALARMCDRGHAVLWGDPPRVPLRPILTGAGLVALGVYHWDQAHPSAGKKVRAAS